VSSRTRSLLIWLGIGLIVFGVVNLAVGPRTSIVQTGSSIDFDLNWVAARRLVERQPLYDGAAARAEAVRLVGPSMRSAYRTPFSSYIGPPTTALLHTPFLLFDHDTAADLFGIIAVLGMALAVIVTAQALPPASRLPASLVGLGALLSSFPALRTLEVGQGNELVMLGLAVGVWGASRQRWGLAGVGLGIATMLKVSPVFLLVYLVLRGNWRAARSALVTVVAMSGLASIIGRPTDLVVWIRDVVPSASSGPIHVYNQSLVASIERLVTNPSAFGTFAALGVVHFLAYAIAGAGTLGLWYARRRSPFVPLELGALILVVLLAGPLSWDHYFTWALIPITLMIDVDLWRGRSRTESIALAAATGAAVLLLYQFVTVPGRTPAAADWALRLTTSPYTLATVILTGVAACLLLKPARANTSTKRSSVPG
jgi:alpha-1,2-mannosyltransferase